MVLLEHMIITICYGLNCVCSLAKNLYIEALPLVPQNVTLFRNSLFKEVLKLK